MSDCDCDRCNVRRGEPDTADLIGKINEICERVGLGEGSPVELVERLAQKLAATEQDCDVISETAVKRAKQVAEMDRYIGACHDVCREAGAPTGCIEGRVQWLASRLAEARSDLAAERAQLAAMEKPVQWAKPSQSEPGPSDDALLCDFTRLLLKDTAAAHEFIALARLATRLHAALKKDTP